MDLLQLIHKSLFTGATTKQSTKALQEAKETLMAIRQHENMEDSDYLEKFKSYVGQVEHHGGQAGCSEDRIHPLID